MDESSKNSPDARWATEFFRQTVTENQYLKGCSVSPPQFNFLTRPAKEIMYGGAAGGGKSRSLLYAALQFIPIAGYAALLLRRSFADLYKPDALIPQSHDVLRSSDAAWDGQKNQWKFPNGATLSFGYLATEGDKYQYQGAAYDFIGFDELTQFTETQYTYLYSRLRKKSKSPVPLRMRSASNPGGLGHEWVFNRFVNPKSKGNRVFIPARLEDNPYLDKKSYEESLSQLDHITRRQLRHGDWTVRSDEGLLKRQWFGQYKKEEGFYRLRRGEQSWLIHPDECQRIATVDVAATVKSTSDFSVFQCWDIAPTFDAILAGRWRARMELPEVVNELVKLYRAWNVNRMGVERAGVGIGVYQTLLGRGLTIFPLRPKGHDKAVRAQAAMIRAEAGYIHVPADEPWTGEWLDVVTAVTKETIENNSAHDDDFDCLAYMGQIVHKIGGAPRDSSDDAHAAKVEAEQIAEEQEASRPGGKVKPATVGADSDDDEVAEWLKG